MCFVLTESGIVADISSNQSSPVKEDAYTQTTLKRPGKTSQGTDTARLSLVEQPPDPYPEASNV